MAIISDCPYQFLFPESSSPSSSNSRPPPFSSLPAPSSTSNVPSVTKTFAQAISISFDIHLSQLPKPCLKGNELAIKISESEYQAGVQDCKNILYGRLTLSKGDSPIKLDDLRVKLLKSWRPVHPWTVVSLGKGF